MDFLVQCNEVDRGVRVSSVLDNRSKKLRRDIVSVLSANRRGHLAPAFSLVEILRVLYDDILRFDANQPDWPERDRFILSKGHGCIALYVLLAENGFITTDDLQQFCTLDGLLGGHPEHKVPGIEASTGSLGHGLSLGIGFALNARHDKTGARVFVVLGDGECNEGSIWEAAMSAAKHRLDNLTVIIDYNKQQSYGATCEVLDLEPFADKWRVFGFGVHEVDGHDADALNTVMSVLPFEKGRPNTIICHTVKGKGVSFTENNPDWHHKSRISDEDIEALLDQLGDVHA